MRGEGRGSAGGLRLTPDLLGSDGDGREVAACSVVPGAATVGDADAVGVTVAAAEVVGAALKSVRRFSSLFARTAAKKPVTSAAPRK